ncbi:hypothetical protein Trisim1_012519 [Trichoderma cf. simile WF8]
MHICGGPSILAPLKIHGLMRVRRHPVARKSSKQALRRPRIKEGHPAARCSLFRWPMSCEQLMNHSISFAVEYRHAWPSAVPRIYGLTDCCALLALRCKIEMNGKRHAWPPQPIYIAWPEAPPASS